MTDTRAAVLSAFTALVFERRYEAIRVSDLTAAAGVGRATFYEHFRGKDAVLLAAMDPVLTALAIAATGPIPRPYIQGIVSHLWDRRGVGRTILGSASAAILQRRLAEIIRLRLEQWDAPIASPPIAAAGIAAAQIAMLRSWLAGEASATPGEMADRMIACSGLVGSAATGRPTPG